MKEDNPTVLPCPFCGEVDALLLQHRLKNDAWWVACESCEAEGPSDAESEEHAILRWNEAPREQVYRGGLDGGQQWREP